MELKMFIQDQLIDAIPINPMKLGSPAYLYKLQMELEDRNENIIDLTNREPEFFLDHVPSLVNREPYVRN